MDVARRNERPATSLDYVPILFFARRMWMRDDDLRLSIVMGLRAGLKLIRGMRRSLSEDEQHKVADAIMRHLASTNWKIERGPSAQGRGQHIIPPR
jgi:hypothetical protein